MDNELVETAAKVLHISEENASQYCKKIPEINAWYFWNPVRGGGAVIIDENKEKLGATSSVSFERHLRAFMEGRRN